MIEKQLKIVLFGYRYILINEENEGYLKNAKSFVKVIELCVKCTENWIGFIDMPRR